MNFLLFFVYVAQKKEGYNMRKSESQKKATRKYIKGQWRPSMYIDKELQPDIEKHFKEKGYKTFNEYVNALVSEDMSK